MIPIFIDHSLSLLLFDLETINFDIGGLLCTVYSILYIVYCILYSVYKALTAKSHSPVLHVKNYILITCLFCQRIIDEQSD